MTFQPVFAKAIMNDDWITNSEVPDPEVLPEIPGYHLLIRPLSIRQQTKGGVLLPDKLNILKDRGVVKEIMYVILNIVDKSLYIKEFVIYLCMMIRS